MSGVGGVDVLWSSRIVVVVVVVAMGCGHRITVVDTLWMQWTRGERVGVVVVMASMVGVVVVEVVATVVVVVVMGCVVILICRCCWWAIGDHCQSCDRKDEVTYDGDDMAVSRRFPA